MEGNFSIIINNKKLIYFLNLLLFLCLSTNCDCILNGEYPLLKKLNNDRYILICQKGITFLDPSLTISSNSVIFEQDPYNIEESTDFFITFSTLAVQFPEEDGSLILAMLNDKLLIFDSNETLLNNITIIQHFNYYTKKSYYIIPYKRLKIILILPVLLMLLILRNLLYI